VILTYRDNGFKDAARHNGLWVRTGGQDDMGNYYEDFERVLSSDDRFTIVLGAALERGVAVVFTGKTYQRWQERLGE